MTIPWKKISRGLPKGKRYADDRAPTMYEIRKIIEYPDRRVKPIIYLNKASEKLLSTDTTGTTSSTMLISMIRLTNAY